MSKKNSKKQRTYTDTIRLKLWILRIADIVTLVVPAFAYVIIALANGEIGVGRKFICSFAAAIAVIITVTNLFLQKKKRSVIWIVLIGLYIAIRELLLPLIVMLGCASLLDDFVFSPMISHAKTELISSKVYDKRREIEENPNAEFD